MQLVRSIYIRYLRSIHRLALDEIGDLTVLSGANDVGKSNVLKSLNLFFNTTSIGTLQSTSTVTSRIGICLR